MTKTEASMTEPTGERLHVETWGEGERVVLVHGSLALGAEEWEQQRVLAREGFELLVPDRRGYGNSPAAEGEDFLVDADDIIELMGDGAHLVGHSYGGLGVLCAAARRPDATLSLTVLEPPAFTLGRGRAESRALVDQVRGMWDADTPDAEWVVDFLKAIGSDPDEFPAAFLEAALPLVPVVRGGRRFWDPELSLDELAAGAFPKVVVTGGHSAGFEGICDEMAERIGAARAVVEGAGHEVQFAAPAINELLLSTWRSA